ncbi:MAG: cysteine synthase family protein [Rhodospirillaceae bacterium]|jgi:cysteine synthase|nr:cysteine synthase family protein [Rhodospirillaceae bacterium]MBT6136681.1 cysteine synthase family protein [Rhodospirillaceae bacterium]
MRDDENIKESVLGGIGDTALVVLSHVVPPGHARVLVKLESGNPTGSMKDRMALAMIEAAENDGRLPKGGVVVEYTGGSTGVSLALVCSVKGYALEIVTSDAFSEEKRKHMHALGANLTVVPSNDGGIDEALIKTMVETARGVADDLGAYWTNQLHNVDQVIGYRRMGDEIWRQTEGNVDAFVQMVGTGGCVRGVTEALRDYNPDTHVVAVEPSESAVLSGGETGIHKIEGVGAGFIVPLWKPDLIDEITSVSTEDAMEMARRLAREEGMFAGTSTGGNVVAALRVAERLGPDATVVTVMADSGLKYLSTQLYD